MSKDFKPLFGTGLGESLKFRDEVQRLREEKRIAEERLRELEEQLERLERENRELLEEVKRLRQEVEERDRKLEEISERLKNLEIEREIAEKVAEKIEESLSKTKEELRNGFINLSKEVLREFLMTDVLPREELLLKILDEVFEKFVDLKGSVRVVLNPADMGSVLEFIGGIKEKLGEKVDIEVVSSEEIKPGEVRIETPKFIIERKHEEALEEVFREAVRRVLEGS